MKHFAILLPLMASLLASCQTISAEAPKSPGQAPYKALGTEPFWSLKIENGTMHFSDNDELIVRAPSYQARPSFNGWRYAAKEMTADITFEECSDGMSEYSYKDSVIVKVGERTYKGCGGGILPPEQLDGTAWRIVYINESEMPAGQETLINFDNGRMSGGVGCNRLGADYKFGDGTLSFGPVISTKMGCPDLVAKQERAFLGVLGQLKTTRFTEDGSMWLTGADGDTVILYRSI